nr:VanZ family protein [Prolixibacteraceae bacterium]
YKKAFIRSVIFSIIIGISFEILQSQLTESRTASLLDVFANSIGALFGVLFYQLIIRNKRIEKLIFKIE